MSKISRLRVAALAVAATLALAPAAHAVKPDEMLPDPKQETRARDLSSELRCLVCQNQSIDDSDAELARDLRLLVRERIKAGDSDRQVMDYLVARYGEFVLLRPSFSMQNALLWGLPVLVLLGGAVAVASGVRRRVAGTTREAPLTEAEKARLAEVLKREG
jgi:cytochrome c-type biogenesis protein CcmH